MHSDHLEPAARARHHRRRLPRDDDDNDSGFKILGGGGGGLVPTVTTIVDSIPLIGTTLLRTHVGTILVPASDTTSVSPTPSSSLPLTTSALPQVTSSSTSASSQASLTSSSLSTSASDSSASPSPTNLSDSASASQAAVSTPQADNASHSTHTVSSTVTASPTAGVGASAVGASNKSLSGGAIGAIVAVSIIVGLALMVFLVRKLFLRKRQSRRDTWGAGVFPKGDFGDHHGQDVFEKPPMRSLSPPPLPEKPVTPISAVPMLAPPPTSYNNAPAPSMSPTLQPAAGSPAVALSPAGAGFAHVRCTFIPTLPDELSIAMGESVRVLNEYDDGWALCINNRNEQGVVPLECLDRNSAPSRPGQYLGQGTGDWRMSRRASSLYAAQGPMRY